MKKFQLVNTIYWDNRNKRYDSDKLIMVTKDENGNKSFQTVEKPIFRYYITKPEYCDGKPLIENAIERNKVREVKCYYNNIYQSIVKNLNDPNITNYMKEVFRNGSNIGNNLKKIHLDYRLHSSDKNIEDYYMTCFYEKYPAEENKFGITKSYLDIEVDTSAIKGFPDPERAEAPINVITFINESNMTAYSFALRYDEQSESFVKVSDKLSDFIEEVKEKYKDNDIANKLKYDIRFFDSEIELIQDFFNVVNDLKPDFVLA